MSSEEQLTANKQERLSGGDMLARALSDEGVEVIFGYPGGAVLHIYDALFRHGDIPHVLVRHEQAATHAADAYTRATGKIPVVLVTSGPGATNAITGIATAYMDSIAMVVVSGQVQSHLVGEDAFQETDMIGVSRPIVKHSFQIRDASEIPATIKKAFYIAGSGRPGPVVVDIPKDMTAPDKLYPYSYPAEMEIRAYNPTKRGHNRQLRKAAKVLVAAKKPVIYTGGGVIQGNACEHLRALARKLNFPVTNTLMGLGAFPGTDRQFLGMLGMHGFYEANMAMHNCDVILAVGARFDDRVTNTVSKFCPGATIIHADVDPAAISKTVDADIPIVGEAAVVLQELISLCDEEMKQDGCYDADAIDSWWREIDGWRAAHGLLHSTRYQPASDGTILPQQVIETLYKVTNGEAFVTSDVGQHQMFAAQYYPFDEPRKWINSGGLGTMGFGLPAAMGVKMAHRDADVVCVTGEGSIQMNIQELSTCTHYNLPVKVININNQALGMVKQWQDMQYAGRHSESTYANSLPDFVKLVESYGHVGMRVEKLEDLEPMMRECFAQKDKLVFMDIYVDPEEHVYPMMIAPDGDMSDMYLSKTERS